MSDNYESYKKVGDEYFSCYKAFVESGFTETQAFELIKTFCTSNAMKSLLDAAELERREKEYLKSRARKRQMNEDRLRWEAESNG